MSAASVGATRRMRVIRFIPIDYGVGWTVRYTNDNIPPDPGQPPRSAVRMTGDPRSMNDSAGPDRDDRPRRKARPRWGRALFIALLLSAGAAAAARAQDA